MTPKFNKIAIIDFGYNEEFFTNIQKYSREPIEIIAAGSTSGSDNVDALVCSWKDALDKEHLVRFPKLSYMATRATSTSNIDLEYIAEKNISVGSIEGYGDQATAEFVLQQLLSASRKRGKELSGKTVGFLGFGNVPKLIVEPLKSLGVKLCYYTPSEELTKSSRENVPYVSKVDLLNSDFISVHTPARTVSLTMEDLKNIPDETGLISTTMDLPFDENVMRSWKKTAPNQVIMDKVAAGG